MTKAQNHNEIDDPKEINTRFFGSIEGFEVDASGVRRATVSNLDEILQARRLNGDFVILLEDEKGPAGVLSYGASDIEKMAKYVGLADASQNEKEDYAYNLAEDLSSQYEEYFAYNSYTCEIECEGEVVFKSNSYPSLEEALKDADCFVNEHKFHQAPNP